MTKLTKRVKEKTQTNQIRDEKAELTARKNEDQIITRAKLKNFSPSTLEKSKEKWMHL